MQNAEGNVGTTETRRLSLLECILLNLRREGDLPVGFRLPGGGVEDDDEPGLEDGELEALMLYGTGELHSSAERLTDFCTVLTLAKDGQYQKAEEILRGIGEDDDAIYTIGVWEQAIAQTAGSCCENVYKFALKLMMHSDDRECVKYGIILAGMFRETKQLKEVLKLLYWLSMSDEFTWYVFRILAGWEDANDLMFMLTKMLHGWGRLHALRLLNPNTEEIREWILLEGMHCSVPAGELALTCYVRSNARDKVRQELTPREFSAMGELITALLGRHRLPGISEIPDRGGFLLDYLDQCELHDLGIEDLDTILAIRNYCSMYVINGGILARAYLRAREILQREENAGVQ